jgi:molecular chaperone DnaK (HSP70)
MVKENLDCGETLHHCCGLQSRQALKMNESMKHGMKQVYGVKQVCQLKFHALSHSDKEQSIRIQSSGGLSEDQIQQMVRDAEQYASADKKRKEMIEVSYTEFIEALVSCNVIVLRLKCLTEL